MRPLSHPNMVKEAISESTPDTYSVGKSGCDFKDVQDAIDAAILVATLSNPVKILLYDSAMPPIYETDNQRPDIYPIWVTGKLYRVGDFRRNELTNIDYECIVENTGVTLFATDIDAGKWTTKTPGKSLASYGISIEYANNAWLPIPKVVEEPADLPTGKKIVVLWSDDGSNDMFQRDGEAHPTSGTYYFGGVALRSDELAAKRTTPLAYAINKGIPITLGIIGDKLTVADRNSINYRDKLTFDQIVQAQRRGGFEIAAHTYHHDDLNQMSDAEHLWDNVCKVRMLLSDMTIKNNFKMFHELTSDGVLTFSLPHADGVTGAIVEDLAVLHDAPATDIQKGLKAPLVTTCLRTLLTNAGYPELEYNVSVTGGDQSEWGGHGRGLKIVIGDATTPSLALTCTIKSGSGYILFVPLGDYQVHNTIRGWMSSGSAQGDSYEETRTSLKSAIGRMVDRNYVYAHNYYTLLFNVCMPGSAGAYTFGTDTTAQCDAVIADLRSYKINLIVIHGFHSGSTGGTVNFKYLIDKLSAAQAAGTIECVTFSTAFQHKKVTTIPTLPIYAVVGTTTPVNNRLYGGKYRITGGAITDDGTDVVTLTGASASIAISIPEPLRKNATHTFRFKLKNVSGTAVTNGSYVSIVPILRDGSEASKTDIYGNVPANKDADYDHYVATKEYLPVDTTSAYITRKIYWDSDMIGDFKDFIIAIVKNRTAESVEISELQWFLG